MLVKVWICLMIHDSFFPNNVPTPYPSLKGQLRWSPFPSPSTASEFRISRDQSAICIPPITATVSVQVPWQCVHHESTAPIFSTSLAYICLFNPWLSEQQSSHRSAMHQGHTYLQNRGDPSNSSKFHPVSLLNVVAKVMDALQSQSLLDYLQRNRVIMQWPSAWLSAWLINDFATHFPCQRMAK